MGSARPLLRHLVAGAVLWHALAIVVDATPDTSAGLKRSAWKEATVQAEFKDWAAMFGVPEPKLEDQLWTFAVGWNNVRSELIGPFHRYLSWAHSTQSWQMFVAPHTTPSRLQIQERVAGAPAGERGEGTEADWTTIFEERDPQHAWMASAFGVERMRASVFRWSWPTFEGAWKKACDGLAKRRFLESATTGVRCRFWQAATPSPEQVLDGTAPGGAWVRALVVERPE